MIFEQNAYFDEARFEEEANFSLSEFNQNAHFYGTKFREIQRGDVIINDIPNFLQAIFNGGINLTNTKLGLTFELVEDKIQEIYREKVRQHRNGEESPRPYKVANEFRNVFKNIKDGLIRGNNLLDASLFHKMELYAKELELKYKQKDAAEESSIRDFVDKIQLMFYRLTSDHHTDLLLILNNVIILIACFGLTNFILNILLNQNYFDFGIQKVVMAIGAFIASTIFVSSSLCLILNCWKDFSFSIAWIKNKSQIFKILKSSLNAKANFRTYLVLASYCIMAIIFAVNPTLFLPILGQLLDSKLYIGFTFASLNIVYAILMFLLIWSLQKTARKNTIVPN